MKFRSEEVLARVEKLDDLFASVEKLKQKLPNNGSCEITCPVTLRLESYDNS